MLPDELWANVLWQLDGLKPLSLASTKWKATLMGVCKSWRQILQEPSAWQASVLDCSPDTVWSGGTVAATQHLAWGARIASGLLCVHIRVACTHHGLSQPVARICERLQPEAASIELDIANWKAAGQHAASQTAATASRSRHATLEQQPVPATSQLLPAALAQCTTALHVLSQLQEGLDPMSLHTILASLPHLQHLRVSFPKSCVFSWATPVPLPLTPHDSSFQLDMGSDIQAPELLGPTLLSPPMHLGAHAQHTAFSGHLSAAQPLQAGLQSLGLLEASITQSLVRLHLTCHSTESTAVLDVTPMQGLDLLQELTLKCIRSHSRSTAVRAVLRGVDALPGSLRLLRVSCSYRLDVQLAELQLVTSGLQRLELSAPWLALHGLDDDHSLRALSQCSVMLCTERYTRLVKRMVAVLGFEKVFVFEPAYMGLRGQAAEVHAGWQGSLEHALLGPDTTRPPADSQQAGRSEPGVLGVTPSSEQGTQAACSGVATCVSDIQEQRHVPAGSQQQTAQVSEALSAYVQCKEEEGLDVLHEVWPLSRSEVATAAGMQTALGGKAGKYWQSWAAEAWHEAAEALVAERVRQAQEYA